MDLDNINDIEILRNELKKYMALCVEDSIARNYYDDFNITIKKGNYYYINYDNSGYTVTVNDYIYYMDREEFNKAFDLF